MRLNILKRNIDSVILMIFGLISIGVGLFNIFGTEDIIRIILGLIGLICISIFIERLLKFEEVSRKIDDLKKRFENMIAGEFVIGYENLYNAGIELINDANSFIRATSFGEGEGQLTAPEKYHEVLAEKLKESKNLKQPIEYRVVISSGESFKRSFDNRMQIF
jgi:hypothetical protein